MNSVVSVRSRILGRANERVGSPNRQLRREGGPKKFHCFDCGEEVLGEAASIQLGRIEYRKFGALFIPDTFRDRDEEKWFHMQCIPYILPWVLEHDTCALCDTQFFPEESVVLVLQGYLRREEDRYEFAEHESGHAHFICVCEEWGLALWEINSG